ncbi:MAG: DNA translocase FtsK 4TM domain-containing protein, partial [Rhodothermales bacterium]
MATSTRKKKRTPAKKKAPAVVPAQRKKEVLALILMALALLLTLALATYTPADDPLAQTLSLEAALDPGENRAENALGLVGAALSWALVPSFLGYTMLLVPLFLFAWGYVLFRGKRPVYLPLLTTLGLVGAFMLATLFGWLDLTSENDLSLWSGAWGQGVALWMGRVFGQIGSLILLLLVLAITAMLAVDHDIQRSLDRVEALFDRLRQNLTTWWDTAKVRQEERRLEAAERRQTRQQEREARHKAWETERAARERQAAEQAQRARRQPARNSQGEGRTSAPVAPVAAFTAPNAGPFDVPRLNDRFRPGSGWVPQPEGRTSKPTPPPAQPAPPPSRTARPALDAGSEPPRIEKPTPAAQKPPPPVPGEPELKVQERVEEEKADRIEHEVDMPAEDFTYRFPSIDLLDDAGDDAHGIDYDELEENKRILLDKLETYKIEITDINAIVGPTVTLYELTPAPGIKISRITALEDDLAMAMAARGIRMIAPIPGKSAIGIEIPNRNREFISLRDIIGTAKFSETKMELPVPIGKTIEGEVYLSDLTKMPHLLIAGATGSGKSVGLNALIVGLLYRCHPANLKFVMIDPKKIELQQYSRIADHFVAMPPDADDPIITDFTQAMGVLKSCEKEMERRYDLLAAASVRGLKDYNKKFDGGNLPDGEGHRHLPYIVVVVDELADLMMTAGKEIEGPIARLAQMARAVGIHLVLATQRPSVDVITGLIKANFPSRMAYQVASKIDSRTILDGSGAEGLVGNGDLLYMNGSWMIRLQGPFVSVGEVDQLTEFIGSQPGPGPYALPPLEEAVETDREMEVLEDTDDLFKEAAQIIVRSQQGSVSLLQRKLSVGYTRAARIVDQLEEAGIVGPFEGSKARAVLVESELQL